MEAETVVTDLPDGGQVLVTHWATGQVAFDHRSAPGMLWQPIDRARYEDLLGQVTPC